MCRMWLLLFVIERAVELAAVAVVVEVVVVVSRSKNQKLKSAGIGEDMQSQILNIVGLLMSLGFLIWTRVMN